MTEDEQNAAEPARGDEVRIKVASGMDRIASVTAVAAGADRQWTAEDRLRKEGDVMITRGDTDPLVFVRARRDGAEAARTLADWIVGVMNDGAEVERLRDALRAECVLSERRLANHEYAIDQHRAELDRRDAEVERLRAEDGRRVHSDGVSAGLAWNSGMQQALREENTVLRAEVERLKSHRATVTPEQHEVASLRADVDRLTRDATVDHQRWENEKILLLAEVRDAELKTGAQMRDVDRLTRERDEALMVRVRDRNGATVSDLAAQIATLTRERTEIADILGFAGSLAYHGYLDCVREAARLHASPVRPRCPKCKLDGVIRGASLIACAGCGHTWTGTSDDQIATLRAMVERSIRALLPLEPVEARSLDADLRALMEAK